jgi:hypothetical protein
VAVFWVSPRNLPDWTCVPAKMVRVRVSSRPRLPGHAPFQSVSSRRALGFPIHHVEYFDCAVRGACSQAFSIVVQLRIVLKEAGRLLNVGWSCSWILRTIMSSCAVSIGTDSEVVADALHESHFSAHLRWVRALTIMSYRY